MDKKNEKQPGLKIKQKLTVKKAINVETLSEEEIQDTLRINKTLIDIIHPNIAKYNKVELRSREIILTRDRELFNLDQYLEQMVDNLEEPNEELIMNLLYSLVEAVHYLKTQRLINHNDLKPSNILVSEDLIIKICDAGCLTPEKAKALISLDSEDQKRDLLFLAPEFIKILKGGKEKKSVEYEENSDISDITEDEINVHENESDISMSLNSDISDMPLVMERSTTEPSETPSKEFADKIDVFSIGMIVLRAINFRNFYEIAEGANEKESILKGICMQGNVPTVLGPLLMKMLSFEPSKRPDLGMIKSHLNMKKVLILFTNTSL